MLDKALFIADEIAKKTDEVILFHSASGKDMLKELPIEYLVDDARGLTALDCDFIFTLSIGNNTECQNR